jgi:hypothetical protein
MITSRRAGSTFELRLAEPPADESARAVVAARSAAPPEALFGTLNA